MEFIKRIFNWNYVDFCKALLGSLLFCFSINFFVVPNHLYTGGVLGLSQLIRSLIIDVFSLNISFDFSGILYYLINIPLFVIAYKSVGKTFFFRTIFAVSIQTILLSLLPNVKLVDDLLTNVVLGGLLGGVGVGMILSILTNLRKTGYTFLIFFAGIFPFCFVTRIVIRRQTY